MRSRFVGSSLVILALTAASCIDHLEQADGDPLGVSDAPASVTVEPGESTLAVGETVQLGATVRDGGDAVLEVPVTWSSSDPDVATVSDGGLVRAEAPGSAKITATAGPAAGSADVVVENAAPSVTISAPAGESVTEGATVTFQGTATDPEDGELTASLSWTSDRDGTIGSGGTFQRSDLSVGVHRIVASAADRQGVRAADTASVTVGAAPENASPEVEMVLPYDGAVFPEGSVTSFVGVATDAEDGVLSGSSLVWTSSLDGRLGTGRSFARSNLSVGVHQVTLTATDSRGATATDRATITVESAQQAISSLVLTPDFLIVDVGATRASPFTIRDGDGASVPAAALSWTSSDDGRAVVDGSGSVTGVQAGQADIVARAGDVSDTARVAVAGPADLVGTALVGGAWSVVVTRGAEITVPLVLDMTRVSPNGDLGEAKLELSFDKSFLAVQSVRAGAGFERNDDDDDDWKDKIELHLEADSPAGQGVVTLAVVVFRVRSDAPSGAGGSLKLKFTDRPRDTDEDRYRNPITVGARLRVR